VVGAQILKPQVGVGQQVIDDGEHRVAGGHDRLLFTAAAGDAPVAGAEEAVGAGGPGGDVT
jgi:hypothetical protein